MMMNTTIFPRIMKLLRGNSEILWQELNEAYFVLKKNPNVFELTVGYY
jgi:hypothetical protein